MGSSPAKGKYDHGEEGGRYSSTTPDMSKPHFGDDVVAPIVKTIADPTHLARKVIKKTGFDIKGYLKGEQGFIPDYKGQSTKQTVHKVAKKVAKHTAPNVTQKQEKSKVAQQTVEGFKEGGKMGLKDSMKKVGKPTEKKYTKVRSDLKMKPPQKKPVGPRATPKPVKSKKTAHGQLNDANIEYQEDKKAVGTNIKMPKVMKDGPKNRIHVR